MNLLANLDINLDLCTGDIEKNIKVIFPLHLDLSAGMASKASHFCSRADYICNDR